MPKYNLTHGQELIVCELVEIHASGQKTPSVWTAAYGENNTGLRWEGTDKFLQAEEIDIRSIADARLIKLLDIDQGIICALLPAAEAAVRTNFGTPNHVRLLRALYHNSGGVITDPVSLQALGERIGLNAAQGGTAAQVAERCGWIGVCVGASGTCVYLKPEGVVAAETDEPTGTSSTMINNFHAQVGAYQTGANATANVDQRMETGSADIVEQLRELRQKSDAFTDQQIMVARILQDLISAAESKTTDKVTLTERITKLLEIGKSYVDFGTALMGLGQPPKG